jgi:two-component system sensor kinase
MAGDNRFREDTRPGELIPGTFVLGEVRGHGVYDGTWGTFPNVPGQDGRPVVIKLLDAGSVSPGKLTRTQYEADLLQRLASPCLATPLHVGRDGDRLVIVLPRIEGMILRDRLQHEPLTVEETLSVGCDVFSALRDLHAQRLLHRAVRPANVVLAATPARSASEGEGGTDDAASSLALRAGVRATLVDYGPLAAINPADSATWAELLESARYLSPEQAGSIHHDVNDASDLYSAGVTLFHCLAGRPPFMGSDMGTLLFEQMTLPAAELRSLGLAVPRALDEVIQRLLRKDPRDRYQSAEAVLADLSAIAAGLAGGQRDPAVVVGSQDTRQTLTEPAFVGRAAELGELDRRLDDAWAGRGGLVLLEGESGGGKTRLLSEASHRAACRGCWVLWGQGTSEVAPQPFSLLAGVVQGFLSAAKSQPSMVAAVRERLGDQLPALAAALPGLAEVLGGEGSYATAPEAAGEMRTLNALGSFLAALGTAERPALVILDDCQWADELSYRLFRRWQAPAESDAAPRYAQLIAAFRAEEVADDHPLRRLRADAHLRLSGMTADELRQLLESMAGKLPTEAVEAVAELADNSPFMASAVLRGLVETGRLAYDGHAWQLVPLDLGDVQSSSSAAKVLACRLDLLPDDTQRLLCTGAVLGKEFDLDMAVELAELDPARALMQLDVARRRQLVWMGSDGTRCAFVHDIIREALLQRQPLAERQWFHARAAHFLRQREGGHDAEIAYHFDAAGDSASALPYALRAADQARARYAFETALQQYQIAQRGTPPTDTAMRYRVAIGQGDVLMLRGTYDEAGTKYEAAAEVAEGMLARAEIGGKLGELAFKRGNMEQAISCFEDALRSLGRFVPKSWPMLLIFVAWQGIKQIVHTLFPTWLVHRLRRLPTERERLTLRLLSNLAHGYWYCRSLIHVLSAHLRGMNLAERFLPTAELAQCYAEHAPGLTLVGYLSRAEQYAKKSLAIRRELNDWWGQGQSLHYWGVVLYSRGRYEACIEKCREGIRLLERTGDYWQVHIARYQIAASYYRLGELARAVEESQQNYHSGIELGDEQASGIILDVWARAAHGNVPQQVFEQELQRPRHDAQGQAQVLFAEGLRLLMRGDLEQAEAFLLRAIETADRAGVRNAYTLPFRPWLATVLRQQASQVTDVTPGRRAALLRRAQAAGRRAARDRWLCANDLPHALRELALVSAMLGSARRARRLLDRSLRIARRQEARYEIAQTLLARAALGCEAGWKTADDDQAQGQAMLAQLHSSLEEQDASEPAAATLSLADRFDGVLQWGRRIASALSPQTIYEEARAAALRLLRAEHCVVLRVEMNHNPPLFTPLAGAVPGSWNVDRLREAIGARQASAFPGSPAEDGSNGERSALCVPLYVRGDLTACLYTTHEHVRGLFGPVEQRLAEFIVTIAGAALENAAGFTQLQTLNQTLERRVAERTASAESRARELAASNEQLEKTTAELLVAQREAMLAKQAAEAASDAKSRFLATMSHEIRTPLNGVIGTTELALTTSLTPQQRSYLTTAKESANSLLSLLNDVLDFSKIEAGRMELETIPFSVRTVVEDAARMLSATAARKRLELICHVDSAVPACVIGDPNRLRQVLINLIGNAIKFTEQGEVCVRVEQATGFGLQASADCQATDELCRSLEPEARSPVLRFSVHDTGIGIPADKHASIFEAFRQSDSSMTRRFGGTGLGLAITSQLVSLMGGQIQVESEPGAGSTFHFDLPLVESVDVTQPPSTGLRRYRRALLWSGNANHRQACAALLSHLGLQVELLPLEASGNSLRATADPEAQGPKPEASLANTLLVIDVPAAAGSLPFDPAQLRARLGLDQSQVVVLLPAGQTEAIDTCSGAGLTQFVTKPPRARELAALLEPPKAAGAEAGALLPPQRSLRLLVADDSPVNRDVAAGLLELCGHEVVTASTGREALAAWAEQPFDAIFMDLEMPDMDGIQATERIREQEADTGRSTPIIALTAHALASIHERCLAAGMNHCLTKPLQPSELIPLVASIARAIDQNTTTCDLSPA